MFEIKSTYNKESIKVNIQDNHKTVCVSVSGGTDSALLLWNILQYQKETNNRFKVIIYTSSGRTKKYFNFYHALKVQQWIFNHTGFDHNYVWCTFKQKASITSSMYKHMKSISLLHKPTLFISGRTSWPPEDQLPAYWKKGQTTSHTGLRISTTEAITYGRDKNQPVLERLQDEDPQANKWFKPDTFYYTPMISVDKKWIWGSYKHYGIEDLWNATRSCEGEQPILNEKCGTCWWCKEREWAKT
jgi:hypothetical protein